MLAGERCKQGERELRVVEERYMALNLGETDKKLIEDYTTCLQTNGTPKNIIASMLGHTPEVNERYYPYDASNLEKKKEIIKNRNIKFRDYSRVE